ncbi:hypothetical protein, partial [Enterobacter hormaechei]
PPPPFLPQNPPKAYKFYVVVGWFFFIIDSHGLGVGFYIPVDKPGGFFGVIIVFRFKLRGGGLVPGIILTWRPAKHRAAGQCFLLTSGKNVFLICPHVVQP